MKLLTASIKRALVKNHNDTDENKDPKPVLKLFNPRGSGTWLFTEYDEAQDALFGLCDLGQGFPELGFVSLSEISSLHVGMGLKIERDMHFTANKTLSEYAAEATRKGSLVA